MKRKVAEWELVIRGYSRRDMLQRVARVMDIINRSNQRAMELCHELEKVISLFGKGHQASVRKDA